MLIIEAWTKMIIGAISIPLSKYLKINLCRYGEEGSESNGLMAKDVAMTIAVVAGQ